MADLPDQDRRRGDRRGDERREFRRDVGRRDPAVAERRGRPKRRRRLLILLFVIVVVFFGRRALLVGPTRVAEAEAALAGDAVGPILQSLQLPLLAGPGFGPPVPGDPAAELGDILSPAQRDELERIDARLAPALDAAPNVAALPELLGSVRFVLGREREARLAWETLLRVGDSRQEGRARVGLALTAVRAGLRADLEQDAWFAFELAESHLARVGADHPDAAAGAVLQALIATLRVPAGEPSPLADVVGLEPAARRTLEAAAPAIPRRWTEPPRTPTIDAP